MPALFFVVAAVSSESTGSQGQCGNLALHPGSNGWQSARCCSYPQELLLQLESGAEVHEIEIVARGDLAPRAVEVFLSRGSQEECVTGDPRFELAATLELSKGQAASSRGSTARSARQKLFALCSGQVKLLVHEPPAAGPSNSFQQVALSSVHLWGYKDAVVSKPDAKASPATKVKLGDGDDEALSVLMELGIPLNLLPLDEEAERVAGVDAGTRRLIQELQERHRMLVKAGSFGEAQQLADHLQQLSITGQELQSLLSKRETLLATGAVKGAERLAPGIAALEARRLHLAALHETDWWLEVMSSRFGSAPELPEGLSSGVLDGQADAVTAAASSADAAGEDAAEGQASVLAAADIAVAGGEAGASAADAAGKDSAEGQALVPPAAAADTVATDEQAAVASFADTAGEDATERQASVPAADAVDGQAVVSSADAAGEDAAEGQASVPAAADTVVADGQAAAPSAGTAGEDAADGQASIPAPAADTVKASPSGGVAPEGPDSAIGERT